MVFLRFVGVVNAAIWFGAAIFFTLGAGPAFFSAEMKQLLTLPYAGAAAQIVIARYFVLQQCCGAIALVHLFAEWIYMGRPLERIMLGLVIGLFSLGLIGGFWLQPKLQRLHLTKYRGATVEQRERAAKSFGAWHGVSQTMNLLMTGALLYYLWRLTNPKSPSRFVRPAKFRG